MLKGLMAGGGRRRASAGGSVAAGAVFELDAGNAASYPGSGQTLANVVASPADGALQTAYDFLLGTDGTVEWDDPPFSGTPGGLSSAEYFSFNSDRITLGAANPAFIDTLHKAGAAFTWACAFHPTAGGSGILLASVTSSSNGAIGVHIQSQAIEVKNGPGASWQWTYATVPAVGSWSVVVLSIDEAAGLGRAVINGNYHTFSAANANAVATNADVPLTIGEDSTGGGGHFGHINRMALWNVAHDQTTLQAIYDAWAPRYA